MKISEIQDLTVQELLTKGRDLRVELFNLRLQKASSQLEKSHRIRSIRRDIARIETMLTIQRNKTA